MTSWELTRPDGVVGVGRRRRPAGGAGPAAAAVLPQHVVELRCVQGRELGPERRPGRLRETCRLVVNVQRHKEKQHKTRRGWVGVGGGCLPSLCQCWSATNKSFPIMPLCTESLLSLSCGISEGRPTTTSVNSLSSWGEKRFSARRRGVFSGRGRCPASPGLVVKHVFLASVRCL